MPPRPPRRRGSCTTTRLRVTGKPRQRAQAASTSQRSYVSRRFLAVGATPCRRSGLGGCGWPCGQERADHEVAALVVEDGDRGVRPRTRPAPPVRTGRSARRAQAPTRVRVTEGSAVMVRSLYPSPHSQAPHRPSPLPLRGRQPFEARPAHPITTSLFEQGTVAHSQTGLREKNVENPRTYRPVCRRARVSHVHGARR